MQSAFDQFDARNPHVFAAWCAIAFEHRLDPWRNALSAGEIIENMRGKGFSLTNDYKPHFARKFNRLFPHGKLFRVAKSRADQPSG